ncbi:MAG: SDR family oxidoreductase [Firmicutes bacterium]|nr:SDR family oxidoreductase [Bacillota bacterium]
MIALITGASSGIGRDIARSLARRGCDLILAARNKDRMIALAKELRDLNIKTRIIVTDLSKEENCIKLHEKTKKYNIDILINNAGFGVFGKFTDTPLKKEMNMIDVNIKAVHILTKLFLRDFRKKNRGYILNVASAAAFCPGPLFSSYYASKAYILRLTQAIGEELKKDDSRVYIGTFCPGPVNTDFNNRAGVSFAMKGIKSSVAAEYAVKNMFKRKKIIIPGASIKLLPIIVRFVPSALVLHFCYYFQRKKGI